MSSFPQTFSKPLRWGLLLLISIGVLSFSSISAYAGVWDGLTKPDLAPYDDKPIIRDGYASIRVGNAGFGPAVVRGVAGLVIVFWFRDAGGRDLAGRTVTIPNQTIPVGGQIEVKNPVPIPEKATQLYVHVNAAQGSVDEEFSKNYDAYSNNEKTYPLPLADLAPIGDKITIQGGYANVKVKNVGTAPAVVTGVAGLVTAFWFRDANGKDIAGKTITTPPQTIPVGSEIELKGPVPPKATQLYVHVNAAQGTVDEESYDNNEKTYPLPLPDLVIDDIKIEDDFRVTTTVKNIGDVPADVSGTRVDISWLDGGGMNFDMSGTLAPGDMTSFTTLVAYPESVKTISSHVDITNKVAESTEQNNTKTVDAPALKPDLIISSIDQDGNSVSLHIKNIGVTKFEGGINVSYYWDEDSLHGSQENLGGVTLEKEAVDVKSFPIHIPTNVSVLHVTLKTVKPESKTDNNSTEVTVTTIVSLEGIIKDDVLGINDSLVSGLHGGQIDPEKAAGILPDSPLYGLKEVGRGLENAFTFGDDKKIELGEKIANEKALETSVMIDKGATDDKVVVSAKDAFKNEDKIAEEIDNLRKKDPTKADDLTAKVVGGRLKRETVLDKLKHKITVDDSLQVDKVSNKSLDGLGDLVGKMKDPNKLKDAIDKSTSGKGSPFKPVKDLVAINKISTHIANEKAREILEHANERQADHLKNNLQNLKPKQLELFTKYVDQTTGDKVNTLKALDNVKVVVTDKNVKGVLGTVKQKTASNLVKDIKAAKAKDPQASDIILSDLKKGSITDLRVLSDLKSQDKNVHADIEVVKKTAITNFAKDVNSLKPNEKQKFLKEITKDHLDLTQQAVANDIKKTLPASTLGKELDSTLKTEVKTKLTKVKQNKAEYDEFVGSITSDTSDDKAAINEFTAGFDQSFFKDIMRQQLSYMQGFYSGADPETKKILDQYYFSDPQIKEFYTNFDSAFDKMFSEFNVSDYTSEENGEETMQPENTTNDDSETEYTSGCKMVDDPVCGQDGTNYPNECEAKDNNTEVAYKGECQDSSSESESQSSEEDTTEEVEGASTYNIPAILLGVLHVLF